MGAFPPEELPREEVWAITPVNNGSTGSRLRHVEMGGHHPARTGIHDAHAPCERVATSGARFLYVCDVQGFLRGLVYGPPC